MIALEERGYDRAAGGCEDRAADPSEEREDKDEDQRCVEQKEDRDRTDNDRTRDIAPEHRASRSHSIGDRAAEEAKERVRDARDADSEGREQRRLRSAIGDVGQRDQGDRIAEPTDDLSEPEERKVRGADVV